MTGCFCLLLLFFINTRQRNLVVLTDWSLPFILFILRPAFFLLRHTNCFDTFCLYYLKKKHQAIVLDRLFLFVVIVTY